MQVSHVKKYCEVLNSNSRLSDTLFSLTQDNWIGANINKTCRCYKLSFKIKHYKIIEYFIISDLVLITQSTPSCSPLSPHSTHTSRHGPVHPCTQNSCRSCLPCLCFTQGCTPWVTRECRGLVTILGCSRSILSYWTPSWSCYQPHQVRLF